MAKHFNKVASNPKKAVSSSIRMDNVTTTVAVAINYPAPSRLS